MRLTDDWRNKRWMQVGWVFRPTIRLVGKHESEPCLHQARVWCHTGSSTRFMVAKYIPPLKDRALLQKHQVLAGKRLLSNVDKP